jgi:hypothetical protein
VTDSRPDFFAAALRQAEARKAAELHDAINGEDNDE